VQEELKKMNKPFVSIIMPIYNTNVEHLKEAIESILKQRYSNFEFIIIDDGSTLDMCSIVKSYSDIDKRVKFYKNGINKGLVYTLNKALAFSTGKYIFRMDSDDISKHKRLSVLVKFMEMHPKIDIAGSNKRNFGRSKRKTKMPRNDDEIKCMLLYQNPFVHPSVVFRNESIKKFGISYEKGIKSEDYNLWVMSFIKNPSIKFANIKENLLLYRIHENQITQKDKQKLLESHKRIHKIIFDRLNIFLTGEEHNIYLDFVNGIRILSTKEFYLMDRVFVKIIKANNLERLFNCKEFVNSLTVKYAKECLRQFYIYDNLSAKYFFDSEIGKYGKLPNSYKLILQLLKFKIKPGALKSMIFKK
jgi:glycosyltransferase involved in cell wall biosynthesis